MGFLVDLRDSHLLCFVALMAKHMAFCLILVWFLLFTLTYNTLFVHTEEDDTPQSSLLESGVDELL